MNLEQLWAPWRIGYITGADKKTDEKADAAKAAALRWQPGADERCFLCRGAAAESAQDRRKSFVLSGDKLAVAMLNRYPYNNGHLLVAPRRHVGQLAELSNEEHLEMMQLIARLCGEVERLMSPQGFNIGLNLGRAAGAGVPDHLHWHVVPRWQGDTNFMPTIAGVNVIPQSLEALYDLLRKEPGGARGAS